VANNSQTGFYSDYNTLWAEGEGRLVYWTKDFSDVLDWQADVGRFDLHSIGSTAIDPDWAAARDAAVDPYWAQPRFVDATRDDYRVFDLTGGQGFSSPSIAAGDPRTDQGVWVYAGNIEDNPGINLLDNPDFENGLTGWTTNNGAGVESGSPSAFEGSDYFAAGNIEEGFAEQTVDLLAAGYTPGELDAQSLQAVFGGRIRSMAEADLDRGRIELTFLDGSDAILDQVTVDSTNPTDRWDLAGDRVQISIGTRRVVLRFVADRESGSSNNSYLDHAFLYMVTEQDVLNQGAYGGTAGHVYSAEPHLALRSPDLYVDWVFDRQHIIEWDSYGNTANSPVRIDLYQDSPDGPALIATLEEEIPDTGEYLWIPSIHPATQDLLDFGIHGLRIQISLSHDSRILDRSTEPFSLPEAGINYYVDDAANLNDEYTPDAVGSNRHTGKAPDAPKPNPVNVLRVYDLDDPVSGGFLNVDTGEYALIDPVTVSGSIDLGFGLEEGFTLRGPTDKDLEAIFTPAIPDQRPAALVDIVDADFMSVRNLTLAGAQRGLRVHDGSNNFSASYITAYDHTAEGVRIETNSPASVLDHLVVYGTGDSTGDSAIYVEGPIGEITNTLSYGNTGYGLYLRGTGDARVTGGEFYGNQIGIHVDNTLSGTTTVIGSTDLQAGAGNFVHDNLLYGINARNRSLVAGNTVYGHTDSYQGRGIYLSGSAAADSNVVFGNLDGIVGSGEMLRNRVYDNVRYGLHVTSYGGTVAENVSYSNETGLYVNTYGGSQAIVRNNLIYGNANDGLKIHNGSGHQIVNNTIYELSGDAVRIEGTAVDVALQNNILVAGGDYAVSVAADSQSGFTSDYNLFYTFGTAQLGWWQSLARPTLDAWKFAAFGDQNSLFGDPLFVDPDGAADILGYASPADDGRDDDFHLQSAYGSFHAGALAPVRDVASGLPVSLVPTEVADTIALPGVDRSSGIDRGEGAPLDEPSPNGGFVNLGTYGGTLQASKSPESYVLLMSPNGGEGIPQETVFDIRWRAWSQAGGLDQVDMAYSTDGVTFHRMAQSEANDGSYTWFVDSTLFAQSDQAALWVGATGVPEDFTLADAGLPEPNDVSDDPFRVTGTISVYYVDDDSDGGDEYTPGAVGDDLNDGLSPLRPKASIRSILDSYDLGPGDVIQVDTGLYALSGNIIIGEDDSGVTIQGPTGGDHAAVLDRGLFTSGSYVFDLAGADDVTLSHLTLRGGQYGVKSTGAAG